jgi:phage minor structural protein
MNFDHNGFGVLSACVSCEVTEEANGIFELAMTYPMDGVHFAEIGDRAIIKAKADQFRDPQLFRVYAISKPMNGIVTVLAEHISYDLSGIPVKPFSASTASGALAGLKSNAVVDCPFDFWTDKATQANFKVSVPASIRSRLGGVAGSIIDVYGGEYEFDNFTVKLHNHRGQNRGVSIRYGKNLTDIQQDQNCSNVATGVYPYWADAEGKVLVELPERTINAPGTYNFVKIRTLDLSAEFETQPTVEQLRSKAESYIKSNNIGVPKVSLTVSFAQLEQSEEYKHLKLLERVSLFDTVNVEFPALNVSATAKVVKLVYDVLADRVKSVALGSVRANIADTIANQQQEIQQAPTKSDIEKAKEAATSWLTNGKGYAYFRKDDLGNIVDILFMDTQDVETAVNVMRVGQSGIGFSHNGVNGPYQSAWTIDGNFVADFITTGNLSASLIKSGTLDADLINVINLVAEKLQSVYGDDQLNINGAQIRLSAYGKETFSISNYGRVSYVYFRDFDENGSDVGRSQFGANIMQIGGTWVSPLLSFQTRNGEAYMSLPEDAHEEGFAKRLSWKDNGDGTYTLIGE